MKVYIADDHDIFVDGLKALLDEQPDITVVGSTKTAYDLIDTDELDGVEVLILDLSMPGPPPQKVVENLQTERPSLGIVILTMHDDPYYLRQYLNLGVDGFLTKGIASKHLLDAIRTAHQREQYIDPRLAGELLKDDPTSRANQRPELDRLTRRQQEVLELLALGHTNSEVAEQLNISTRTVESHRAEIMRKLSFESRADLTRFALDHELID